MNRPTALIVILAACLSVSPIPSHAQAPPRPSPLQASPIPPGEVQYYYDDFGRAAGPFSLAEVVQRIKFATIHPSTMMWKSDSPTRLLARDLPELAGPPWPGSCGGANQVIWHIFHGLRDRGPIYFGEETKLKIKVPAGEWKQTIWDGKLPDTNDDGSIRGDTYEACLAVQTPHSFDDPVATYAALLFGVTDDSSGYGLLINGQGQVGVYDDKSPAPLLVWTTIEGAKSGPGAVNILHVVVKGRSATLFVNERKLNIAPIIIGSDLTRIGYGNGSEKSRPDAWKFLWQAATQDH